MIITDRRPDRHGGLGPMIVRGLWDQITGTSHRWRQGVSRDGGTTWDWNWVMEWTKA
ncbi:hypothetical protein [Brevundimonas sp.]